MANAIANSYKIFKESLSVLRRDRKVLLFPVLTCIACFIAIPSFVLPAFFLFDSIGIFSLVFVFLCYFAVYFLGIFFYAAMVIYSSRLVKGDKPSLAGSVKGALDNAWNILLWSLFSATIGIVLEILNSVTREKLDILNYILGLVWSLATFFVIPVIVFEKKTPIDALKESSALFKKRWGEAAIGIAGIGLPGVILGLAGLLLFGLSVKFLPEDLILFVFAIFIIYVFLLAVLFSALNSIYVSALYYFAATGKTGTGFSEEVIRSAGLCRSSSNI
ncbi:MAG: hypothetical protein KBB52_06220 [Candidatus Omnitrophica bacterium]|nr:hypothetical protein [Candidatus Omnitrophota bacterium]